MTPAPEPFDAILIGAGQAANPLSRSLAAAGRRVALVGGGTRALTAPVVVINTGCRPARPDLPGLETVPALDSTSVMDLGTAPGHLLVLGGGYVGLEFGQMFRRFGSRVTVVQRG